MLFQRIKENEKEKRKQNGKKTDFRHFVLAAFTICKVNLIHCHCRQVQIYINHTKINLVKQLQALSVEKKAMALVNPDHRTCDMRTPPAHSPCDLNP